MSNMYLHIQSEYELMEQRNVDDVAAWVAEFCRNTEQGYESNNLLPSISESVDIHPHQFKGGCCQEKLRGHSHCR